jgi:hypothetical protein
MEMDLLLKYGYCLSNDIVTHNTGVTKCRCVCLQAY